MFEATENSDVNSFTGDAFNPGLDSGNDAQAIERRINELSGQLADLTRQLEALKTGAPAASNLDPFSGDAPVHGVDADPFSSPDCATTADRPGREELSEVFSKIKSSFHNDDEELLDESLATTCDSTSGDSEADEELVEPEVSVSMSPATPREPESVAEILARMKASGQLESDLDLVPASDSSSNPGQDGTVAAPASAQPQASQPSAGVESPDTAAQIAAASEMPEDDVQSYMSQLLTRLNGGTPPKEDKGQARSLEAVTKSEEVSPPPAPVESNQTMLEPDEFVPSQVAPERNANLAAMREIALESTRSAVSSSIERRRKAKIMISCSAALASFSAAGFTGMLSTRFGDSASLTAAALVIVGLGMGLMLVKALLDKPDKK